MTLTKEQQKAVGHLLEDLTGFSSKECLEIIEEAKVCRGLKK